MRIAIVTPTFPPYAGGIGKVAAYNAKELVKLGQEVTIFTPWYQEVKKEEFEELKIQRIKPLISFGNAALIPKLSRLLLDFEIIHLHYPFFGGAEIIWLKAKRFKKRNIKIVLHYHMDVVGEGLMKIFFSFHTKIILPQIIKAVDKVIFTSLDYGWNSNIANLVKRKPEKFIEVPNGVDSKDFKPETKNLEFLTRHKIDPDQKVVLFVGGLDKAHYFKGVEYLIEAMSRLRQSNYSWRLIIAGEGELKKEYQDLAGQLNIANKTVFTGYVPNEDLPKYYNLADIVVLPSIDKSEAFGLTLVEAMSCAKPVVASNLAGVRSVFTPEVEGLLAEPKNSDDLATKINYLLSNAEIAKKFGQAGRKKVEQKYDWGIIGQQLDNIYKKL